MLMERSDCTAPVSHLGTVAASLGPWVRGERECVVPAPPAPGVPQPRCPSAEDSLGFHPTLTPAACQGRAPGKVRYWTPGPNSFLLSVDSASGAQSPSLWPQWRGAVIRWQGSGSRSLSATSQPSGSASLELCQGGPGDRPPPRFAGSVQVRRGLASMCRNPCLQEAEGKTR